MDQFTEDGFKINRVEEVNPVGEKGYEMKVSLLNKTYPYPIMLQFSSNLISIEEAKSLVNILTGMIEECK